MNKSAIIKRLAYWAGYCLFAGFSAYMTAKSIAMSFELTKTWIVFIFVFVVALVAGYCLSNMIGEITNRVDPSRPKFIINLIGFLLFWGASFVTNVHYMLMTNEGFKVVSAELGSQKSYVDEVILKNTQGAKNAENDDITDCVTAINQKVSIFLSECDALNRPGLGPQAVTALKDVEEYFERSKERFEDKNVYTNTIFDESKDSQARSITNRASFEQLKRRYVQRIGDAQAKRIEAIKAFHKRKAPQTKKMKVIQGFINDSLYAKDIPQIQKIATPEVYYQFQKVQLIGNIHDKMDKADQEILDKRMKSFKKTNAEDAQQENEVKEAKFRYLTYPSARMFNTFNVWDDMIHSRLPQDMKLFGWILFSLIVDIVAYVLRALARK